MKIKHLVIAATEAAEKLQTSHDDDHEAQEELALWGSICTVSEAVTQEVKSTGVSPTLDQLYEEIKRRYEQP